MDYCNINLHLHPHPPSQLSIVFPPLFKFPEYDRSLIGKLSTKTSFQNFVSRPRLEFMSFKDLGAARYVDGFDCKDVTLKLCVDVVAGS